MSRAGLVGRAAAFVTGMCLTVTAAAQTTSNLSPSSHSAPTACQDFYTYVNAPWLREADRSLKHIIDSSRALPEGTEDTVRVDTLRMDAFTEVGENVQAVLRHILEQARTDAPTTKDPLTKVLGTFYNSCMVTPSPDSTQAAKEAKEKDGRTKRCVDAVDADLSTALGRAYVSAVLAPNAQRRVLALAEQLRTAMEKRLRANTWMTAETKGAALTKLAAMTFRVGMPDAGDDYAALTLSPTDFEANKRAVKYVTYQRSLHTMAGFENKEEWRFRQYMINAVYLPQVNALEIPAVLFQPPYFNQTSDAPESYAGIGYVMGHEMTHAFDPQGARFDAKGEAKNWWSPADTALFKARSEKLLKQYDTYVTIDSIPVNGPLTLNENIADLGGFNVAFDAFHQSLAGKSTARVKAMTPDQRFFTAYAAIWRSAASHDRAVWLARIDPHAPSQWRVNGVLANIPAFAKAFGCKAGDPMAQTPDQRVDIW